MSIKNNLLALCLLIITSCTGFGSSVSARGDPDTSSNATPIPATKTPSSEVQQSPTGDVFTKLSAISFPKPEQKTDEDELFPLPGKFVMTSQRRTAESNVNNELVYLQTYSNYEDSDYESSGNRDAEEYKNALPSDYENNKERVSEDYENGLPNLSAERLKRNNSNEESYPSYNYNTHIQPRAFINLPPGDDVSDKGIDVEDDDDELAEHVYLGDLTLLICSEYFMCRNRCVISTDSEVSGQTTSISIRRILPPVEEIEDDEETDDNDDDFDYLSNSSQGHDHTSYHDIAKRSKSKTTEKLQSINWMKTEQNIEKKLRIHATFQSKNPPQKSRGEGTSKRRRKRATIQEQVCTNRVQNALCFCDELCLIYGDCCADVFQSCFSKSGTDAILDFIVGVRTRLESEKYLVDLPKKMREFPEKANFVRHNFIASFGTCVKTAGDTHMMMVSHCPDEFSDMAVRDKCEKLDSHSLPPVTAQIPGGNITFLNIFCALCHEVQNETLLLWSTVYDCDEDLSYNFLTMSIMNDLVSSGRCNMSFRSPTKSCGPRLCEPDSVLSKSQKQDLARGVEKGICSRAEDLLCSAYYIPSNGYKNPTCQKCFAKLNQSQGDASLLFRHSQEGIINMCYLTYPYKNTNGDPIPRGGDTPITGGLVIILDITGFYMIGDDTDFNICKEDEVIDPFVQECKTLICPAGFEAHKGKCVESIEAFFVKKSSQIFPESWNKLNVIMTTSDVAGYISCDKVIGKTYLIHQLNNLVVDKVVIHDYQHPEGLVPDNSSTSCCSCEEYIVEQESKFFQRIDIILYLKGRVREKTFAEIESIAESLIQLSSIHDTPQVLVTNTGKEIRCPNGGRLVQTSDFSLIDHKGDLYAVFNHTHEGVYYLFESIGYELIIDAPHGKSRPMRLNETVYICQESELASKENCSVVSYWLNETREDGERLMILSTEQYYNEGDYEVHGEQVFVCSKFQYKEKTKTPKQSVPYLIVTSLFTMASIIFLILMLIVYCMLPELCTLPGKMTASLAGAMMLTFLFNMFTLVELHHDYICPLVAAISHVVTLSHFGWMSAIAVNMALTFGPGTNNLTKRGDEGKTFRVYASVIWGISVAIVSVSIIIDFSTREEHDNSTSTKDKQSSSRSPVSSSTAHSPDYPRYGDPFCTWFSGPLWARLAFVIIPYFLTYIISLTGFILTLWGIHKTTKTSEKSGIKSSDKARVLIYLKLSTAMGFSWITSILVNAFPNCDVLPYIYECLVLLQGVLLFLAFMANKKVYCLLKNKYFRKSENDSSNGTQISIISSKSL